MKRLTIIGLALAAGCQGLYQDSYLRPGTLQFHTQPVEITVPATATRNVPFNVEFTTYGGGCTERAPGTVGGAGLDIRIWSWQRVNVPGPNGACTDELRLYHNVVAVTIRQSGTARLRIYGQREPGGDPFVFDTQVQVVP